MSEGVLVPDGWEVCSIDSLTDKIIDYRGKSPPKSEYGIPLLTAKNIRAGYLDKEPREYIDSSQYDNWMVKGIPVTGDVFVTTEAPLGNIALAPDYKFAIGQRVLALCPNRKILFPNFLFWILQSESVQKIIELNATGSTVLGIKQSTFSKITIPLPPLPEQNQISSILTSVDDVIEKTEAQISKLQDLKKGMMTELLTKGIGHTEFKDSPVGRIPKGWEVLRFNDVSTKIQDGTHFSPQSKSGEYKYITSKNIKFGFLDVENIEYISKDEHEEIYRRCDVQYGDILLTKDGAKTGNAALNSFKEPVSLLSSVAFIRCDHHKCLNSYFFQYLLSDFCQKEIADLMTGNAITRLTLEKIKNMKLPVPTIGEQKTIALTVSSIDTNILSKKQKLYQTKALKKALMNDLLTGNKRVNVN